jgi:RNA polymerase-binding transcription factor DksA
MSGDDVYQTKTQNVIMKKIFRRKLEKQRAVLARRLEKEPQTTFITPRHFWTFRRDKQKLRKTLLFTHAKQQIKAVEDAIERLDNGVYGQCVVCGEPIQTNRLEALPTATHCWSCQHKKTKI